MTSQSRSGISTVQGFRRKLAESGCVVLDGGLATELQRTLEGSVPKGEELWGTLALLRSPDSVRDVHAGYVRSCCDVISTNT